MGSSFDMFFLVATGLSGRFFACAGAGAGTGAAAGAAGDAAAGAAAGAAAAGTGASVAGFGLDAFRVEVGGGEGTSRTGVNGGGSAKSS